METVEDFELAMEVLNRYQKDKNFLKKEHQELKHKSQLVMSSDLNETKKKLSVAVINPLLVQEERHRLVQEKREQRLKV